MALTTAKRHRNSWYWCVEYEVNGLITEVGNFATTVELIVWLSAHREELPKGEGKFKRKRAVK